MTKLVIDTSIIIDYLRGGNKWEKLILRVDRDTEFYLPTVVVFELFSGQSSRIHQNELGIINFIKYFQRIELTEDIAKKAGELYRDISATLQIPDYIIAASALDIGGTILTLNRKHFEKISGINLYPLD